MSEAEGAGNLGGAGQEGVELTEGEHTGGSAVALSEDGQEELVERCMCAGIWVSDGLLKVGQVLVLAVLLNVVIVDVCVDVDGCDLGDQVIGGPVHELFEANPAAGWALTEIKHVEHGLAGGGAAL